ncbi:MAG: hypothetical protein IH944_11495 [Armatimonadetes bacterium]|nr:hypothetical protein [Armatimonadota bacterium]
MNRLAIGACAALVCTSVFAQDLDQSVTFSRSVGPARQVVRELGNQLGLYLDTNGVIEDELLLLHVTDQPLSAVMDKIAEALSAKWIKEEKGYRLVDDVGKRKSEELSEARRRTNAFAEGLHKKTSPQQRWTRGELEKMMEQRARTGQSYQSYVRAPENSQDSVIEIISSSMLSQNPAQLAASQVLGEIPPKLLASVGPGDRIVYTSRPNRMQKRFLGSLNSVAKNFIFNHNVMLDAKSRTQTDSNVRVITGTGRYDRPLQQVGKILIILSRSYRSDTVSVEVVVADQQGVIVSRGRANIAPVWPEAKRALVEPGGEEITVTPLAREMAQLFSQDSARTVSERLVFSVSTSSGNPTSILFTGESKGAPDFSEDLMRFLVQPHKFDPTSLYVSQAFEQAAASRDLSLVASFPDSIVIDLARRLTSGKLTVDELLTTSSAYGAESSISDGWLVVRPTWPASARLMQFNRVAAAKLFGAVANRGFATLDELAAYSIEMSPLRSSSSLDTVYLGMISPDVAELLSQYTSGQFDLLRLYATLPYKVSDASQAGGATLYGQLNGKARQYAQRAVYRPGAFGFLQFAGGYGVGNVMLIRRLNLSEQERQIPTLMSEPTEALPNGVPTNTPIVVARTVEDGIFATVTGRRGGKFFTAQEFAMHESMARNGFGAGSVITYNQFQTAEIGDVTLTIKLGDMGDRSATFRDARISRSSKKLTLANLPAPFLEALAKARERMRTTRTYGVGSRRQPPPAP